MKQILHTTQFYRCEICGLESEEMPSRRASVKLTQKEEEVEFRGYKVETLEVKTEYSMCGTCGDKLIVFIVELKNE